MEFPCYVIFCVDSTKVLKVLALRPYTNLKVINAMYNKLRTEQVQKICYKANLLGILRLQIGFIYIFNQTACMLTETECLWYLP
jgi:hypothetical protein